MTAVASDTTVFAMPSLGADMEAGRITEWLVQPGDHVERGQIVVIVETDKSDIEVEVFEPGVFTELLVHEGQLVPVGTPIARIEPARGGAPKPSKRRPVGADRVAPDHAPVPPEPASTPPQPVQPAPGHVTSPLIRHLAEQLHVDAEHVHGSGPGGRVMRCDVERAVTANNRPPDIERIAPSRRPRISPRARRLLHEHGLDAGTFAGRSVVVGDDVLALAARVAAQKSASVDPSTERAARAETMRRHIADLMTRSWREIPHYHVSKRIDLASTIDRLQIANAALPLAERVVPGAVLLCAAARAAAAVPACNGWWRNDRFEQASDVTLGVVLSLRTGGIIVPAIEHADTLSSVEMMARLTELVQRTRQGRLRASDFADASITVTSLGDRGADSVGPIIHPPQVVIVGFGALHDEVWPIDGRPVVRATVQASVAGDHRAIDGLTGSRYLAQLDTALHSSEEET
jgi:pyruvate dehydrogenase E2 component (dihydrolipoamide acetyltransferase)